MKSGKNFFVTEATCEIGRDTAIIGIVSKSFGYKLASRMSRVSGVAFRSKDMPVWFKKTDMTVDFEAFCQYDKDTEAFYILCRTKEGASVIIPQWKDFDFLLIVVARDCIELSRDLMRDLTRIDLVQLSQQLFPVEETSRGKNNSLSGLQLNMFDDEAEMKLDSKKTEFDSKKTEFDSTRMKSNSVPAQLDDVLYDIESYVDAIRSEENDQ